MRKTFKLFCAAALAALAVSSCYDDSFLKSEIDRLDNRVDSLASVLNKDVANLAALQSTVTNLETSLKKAIADGDAAVKKALEDALAAAEADIAAAIAAGDKAVADALAAEKAKIEAAIKALETGLGEVTSDVETLETALKALEATVGANYKDLLKKLDEVDGVVDGHIADMKTALDALAAADEKINKELVAAVAKIAVVKVEEVSGKIVLTLADGKTVELSKPMSNVDNKNLVTIVEVDGVKYWAVVGADGTAKSLDIPVEVAVEFQINSETNELEATIDGGKTWVETGIVTDAVVNADAVITDFEESDDYVTITIGGTEIVLPKYVADNSVITIKSGKTYFKYGETVTVDVALTDIVSVYVMTKPDGWKAKLDGKKLTVTAPSEANVTAGVAEADGEVLLHCTSVTGDCKVARLAVATTPGFSLTVDKKGNLTIVNPEVVTTTNMWDETFTDFNDAYIGLATPAAFEANPVAYVEGLEDSEDNWYYLSNWKTNTAEMDEDWNTIYTIGGEYVADEYEVDIIKTTVPQMYADWTYGDEIPAKPYIVWACPMDEMGMPRVEDLVYAYYYPAIKATITEVESSTSDVEVKINVSGATSYYVGLAIEEMLYGWPIDEYMQNQEGPFGYFQMALQYGMADYAFQQMGVLFGGEDGMEMPETITASVLNNDQPLMPSTKFYMWVFPVVEGLDLADYTYEENLKPYIYEFTTEGLSAGGTATVEFGETDLRYTYMSVDLTATEGSSMIYYNWFEEDEFNEIEESELADLLIAEGYVLAGEEGIAMNESEVTPGSKFVLAVLAVDGEGKYGEVDYEVFTAPTIEFSETFVASFGEVKSSVFNSGYKYDFPITVTGGTAAKYYYVWSTKEYTDDELANLPLVYDYDYNFRSTTNVSAGQLAGQYANPSSTYYLAVVVESTDGELSAVIKKTIEVPAAAEEE